MHESGVPWHAPETDHILKSVDCWERNFTLQKGGQKRLGSKSIYTQAESRAWSYEGAEGEASRSQSTRQSASTQAEGETLTQAESEDAVGFGEAALGFGMTE